MTKANFKLSEDAKEIVFFAPRFAIGNGRLSGLKLFVHKLFQFSSKLF